MLSGFTLASARLAHLGGLASMLLLVPLNAVALKAAALVFNRAFILTRWV
jgi:hypothetical protein